MSTATLLTGRTLTAARWLWVGAMAVCVGLSLAFFPSHLAQLGGFCESGGSALAWLGLSAGACTIVLSGASTFTYAAYVSAALFIAWRRSNDWLVLLASVMYVSFISVWTSFNFLMPIPAEWRLPVDGVRALGISLAAIVYYLFPDGRFVPGVTRLLTLWIFGHSLLWVIFPDLPLNPTRLETVSTGSGFLYWLGFALSVELAQVYRIVRVADPIARQQTKWLVFGLSVYVIAFSVNLALLAARPVFAPAFPSPESLFPLLLPVLQLSLLVTMTALGLSILRHRLWDIDILIRRTLTYSLLTGALTLIYFASIVLILQALAWLGPVVGRQVALPPAALAPSPQPDTLSLVISTLLVFALFAPLRSRLQHAIDRRFFRSKYDAQKVLADFAATCRDETDLEKLTARLVEIVAETMQPESLSVWLKPAEPLKRRES